MPIETIECQTVYLPGHDQGEPVLATEGSGGYDLPAILSRACMDVGKSRFFSWQSKRHAAVAELHGNRVEFDNVTEFLRGAMPVEIPKIKQMGKFPYNYLSLVIKPGETVLVPLGIQTAFPEEKTALLFCRASAATKEYDLGNCVGVVDSDYRDEWFAAIHNHGSQPLMIKHGQAIVQVVFVDRIKATFPKPPGGVLPASNRKGGFGSTDAAVDPLGQLTGSMTRTEAATLAAGMGQMTVPESVGIPADSYDEPLPETEAGRAVAAMISEATPEEDAILDALLEEEERKTLGGVAVVDKSDAPRPEPPAAAVAGTPASALDINLSVTIGGRTIEVGPVAKFRPSQHLPLLAKDGPKPVIGALLREMQTLVQRAFPKLFDQIKAELEKKG